MIIKGEVMVPVSVGEGVKRKIIARGGGMMAVEVSFKKGAVGQLHSHTHEQISYIIKGSFEYEIEGKKEIISVGDSYYVWSDAVHGVVALEDAIILDVFTPQREDFL